MARPNKREKQRRELIPIVTKAIAENGYRKVTTRSIAESCEVDQSILFRLWPGGKKEMFLAAFSHVWEQHRSDWETAQLDNLQDVIELEARVQGSHGLFRIVFQALAEADDPEIRIALAKMYRSYVEFMTPLIESATGRTRREAEVTAWSLMGLGTISRIGLILDIEEMDREEIIRSSSRKLIE